MFSKGELVGRIIVEQRSKPLWHSKWNPDWFIGILLVAYYQLVVSTHLKKCFKLHHFPIFRDEHKKHVWNHPLGKWGISKTPPSPKVCQPSSCSRWTSEWQEKKTLRERTAAVKAARSPRWMVTCYPTLVPHSHPCHQFKPFARAIFVSSKKKDVNFAKPGSWSKTFSVDTYF